MPPFDRAPISPRDAAPALALEAFSACRPSEFPSALRDRAPAEYPAAQAGTSGTSARSICRSLSPASGPRLSRRRRAHAVTPPEATRREHARRDYERSLPSRWTILLPATLHEKFRRSWLELRRRHR